MQFIETNNSTQQRVCWLHRREAASHQLVDGRRDTKKATFENQYMTQELLL